MTEIYFGEREGRYSIQAEGHAGYRPGNDIVCAAISVLLQTLWVNLSEICGGSGTQKEGDGIFFFSLKVEEEMRPQAEALFYGTLRGLEMLAEEYPQNVRLNNRRCPEALTGGAAAPTLERKLRLRGVRTKKE